MAKIMFSIPSRESQILSEPARFFILVMIVPLALLGCGSQSAPESISGIDQSSSTDQSTMPAIDQIELNQTMAPSETVKFNQIGFYPNGTKVAVVMGETGTEFELLDRLDNVVFSGDLSDLKSWQPAIEQVRLADFSVFNTEGEYRLRIDGLPESDPIHINQTAFQNLHRAALKYYYFNRSGLALDETFAGMWQRAMGHPDTEVLVHSSAASAERPEGTMVSAPMGWYDAGDFNKYVVNSGITTYTLLSAYEYFPEYFSNELDGFIPESGNGLPDILDEALWNINWLLAMQDPNDGGVYHKLTAKRFQGVIMPADAVADRYVVQKSTSATLDFAAVMAVASRIFSQQAERLASIENIDVDTLSLSGLADDMLESSELAWKWAMAMPNELYFQPSDVSTGEYGDSVFRDEFAWAAAELFITTGDGIYYNAYLNNQGALNVPNSSNVDTLAAISLLKHRHNLANDAAVQVIDGLVSELTAMADDLVTKQKQSAYGVAYGEDIQDFVWGGNAVAMNQSLMLIAAYQQIDDQEYLSAALANLDYVLGRNPLAMSYVTGIGERTPMFPHHRVSAADELVEPVPGMLVGGAQPEQQDGCIYPSNLPALSYLDDFCSYSSNEVAINWNAPLVFVSAALDALLGVRMSVLLTQ